MLSVQRNPDTSERLTVNSGYETLIFLLKPLFYHHFLLPYGDIDFIYYTAKEIIVCKELCVI